MTGRTSNPLLYARLSSLKSKHEKLDRKISEEEKSAACADFYLKQLKQQKLLIKDKMYSLADDLAAKRSNLC